MPFAVVAAAIGSWLWTGPLHRYDPDHPPATITWHGCPYSRIGPVESLGEATDFEHQAAAYQNVQLQEIGSDGGLAVYGLPLNLNNPYPCNGPWHVHLKTGADQYWRYRRPGGP